MFQLSDRQVRRLSAGRPRAKPVLDRQIARVYPGCMCGRYTNTAGIDELNDHFAVPLKDDAGTKRFNIAPTEEVLALVAPEDRVEPRLLRWGLVPSWSKDLKGAQKLINARMESVTLSPAYRGLIGKGSRRALQVADGYFEWLKPERRGEPRQPFFFQVDGGCRLRSRRCGRSRRSTGSGSRASRCSRAMPPRTGWRGASTIGCR